MSKQKYFNINTTAIPELAQLIFTYTHFFYPIPKGEKKKKKKKIPANPLNPMNLNYISKAKKLMVSCV